MCSTSSRTWEEHRGNGAATRNPRLAAIKAFMRYVEFRVSELVALPLANLSLHRPPSIRVYGKGRRERALLGEGG